MGLYPEIHISMARLPDGVRVMSATDGSSSILGPSPLTYPEMSISMARIPDWSFQ